MLENFRVIRNRKKVDLVLGWPINKGEFSRVRTAKDLRGGAVKRAARALESFPCTRTGYYRQDHSGPSFHAVRIPAISEVLERSRVTPLAIRIAVAKGH